MLRLPANFVPDFEAQTQFSGKTSISVNSLSYLSNCEWEQHSQRGISQILLSLSHLRNESPQKLLLFSSSKSTRRLAQMSLRIKWSVMRYDHEHTSLFTRNMDRMKCWMYVTGGASSFLLDFTRGSSTKDFYSFVTTDGSSFNSWGPGFGRKQPHDLLLSHL